MTVLMVTENMTRNADNNEVFLQTDGTYNASADWCYYW